MIDTRTLTDRELYEHYRRTAWLADLDFFVRVAQPTGALADDFAALRVQLADAEQRNRRPAPLRTAYRRLQTRYWTEQAPQPTSWYRAPAPTHPAFGGEPWQVYYMLGRGFGDGRGAPSSTWRAVPLAAPAAEAAPIATEPRPHCALAPAPRAVSPKPPKSPRPATDWSASARKAWETRRRKMAEAATTQGAAA